MTMKTEAEVQEKIQQIDAPPYIAHGEPPAAEHIMGDTFQYGRFVGRMEALRWVLGSECGCADLSGNREFAEWCREDREEYEAYEDEVLAAWPDTID
jgi:hypothetical protein